MTALEPAPDGLPHHYRADDYETLVDSPVVAGNPSVHEFAVDGSKHVLVDIGDTGALGRRRARTSSKTGRGKPPPLGFSSRSSDISS